MSRRRILVAGAAVFILVSAFAFSGAAAAPNSSSKEAILDKSASSSKASVKDFAKKTGINFEKQRVQIGKVLITVEIADDNQKRAQGLMYRARLDSNCGMLFIFEEEQQLTFWMKNTRIPLSIAFVGANKRVVDIQEMVPASDIELAPTTYSSKGLAKYALEMDKAWFTKNKIKVGDSLKFF